VGRRGLRQHHRHHLEMQALSRGWGASWGVGHSGTARTTCSGWP